ncbi:MAG: NAD-dependent epimerase/dehydratase family protein [Bacteroidetes bacterium]|nr:MAG: NAD-dependent epimerase/dehydratase family protein [Bacteroidota bacterium]
MEGIKEKIQQLEGPVFIFGASGFIGANLLDTILKYRSDCYAITHNPRSDWRLRLLDVRAENILHCDINYRKSVESIFKIYQPKTIFNLSAYGAYSKQDNTSLIYETNIIGTVNILEHCKNIKAYVHAGSSSEYGLNSANPKEDDSLVPNSHYSVSKVAAGYLLSYFAREHHVPCLNLRLYSIYGPWEEPDRLMPKLIEQALQGSYPPLVNPDTTRDFVYIDDCVEAFLDAANNVSKENSGQSINIGSGQKTTLKELTSACRQLFKIENEPVWGGMANRNWDTSEWYGNYDKANRLINWKPRTSLNEGLLKFAAWQKAINYINKVLPAFNAPKKLAKISPVIACYKDAQSIPILYDRLIATFNKIGCNYEIIFVNDDSPDNTEKVLQDICDNDLDVISIKHSRNFGSQAAFVSGMEIATGDAVVLMDGDGQDPPELITRFFEQWQNGYEVVYGRRVKREASFFMNFAYKSFYRIFHKMSSINIPQDAGDFSLIDKKVVEQIVALPEKEQFLRGLRAWVGFKQTGVNYERPERMFGVSTNNLRKNIWWAKKGIFSFSYLPLEIMSYAGLFLTIISFLTILLQGIAKMMYPDIPHGVSTVIVLVLFFGGVQLLAIAVIGEYLSKVLDEAKARPKFIRDKVIIRGRTIDTNSELKNILK